MQTAVRNIVTLPCRTALPGLWLLLVALSGPLHAQPTDSATLLLQGNHAFQKGAFSEAATRWEQAVTQFRARSDAQSEIRTSNASAITLQGTEALPMRRFDLMFEVNVRATYACSRACIPHLLVGDNPHILNLSPPLNMNPAWFRDHLAYTMSKYGMSLCVLGMAEEFRDRGIAVNALWPRTVIATAAINMLDGLVMPGNCRTEDIMADAAHAVLVRKAANCTGNFFIDENVLFAEGVRDFERYAIKPGAPLMKDLFLD
jgi:citronellol/citronellal dehydrogenase